MEVLLLTLGVLVGLALLFLIAYKVIKRVSWREAIAETIGNFLP